MQVVALRSWRPSGTKTLWVGWDVYSVPWVPVLSLRPTLRDLKRDLSTSVQYIPIEGSVLTSLQIKVLDTLNWKSFLWIRLHPTPKSPLPTITPIVLVGKQTRHVRFLTPIDGFILDYSYGKQLLTNHRDDSSVEGTNYWVSHYCDVCEFTINTWPLLSCRKSPSCFTKSPEVLNDDCESIAPKRLTPCFVHLQDWPLVGCAPGRTTDSILGPCSDVRGEVRQRDLYLWGEKGCYTKHEGEDGRLGVGSPGNMNVKRNEHERRESMGSPSGW